MSLQTFIVKVKYTKQLDNGTFKRVSEPMVFEGYTFGHVEERVYKHMEGIRGEVNITNINPVKYDDVHFGYVGEDEEAIFGVAKVTFESLDLDSDKTKAITNKYLLRGASWKQLDTDLDTLLETIPFQHNGIKVRAINVTDIVDFIILSDEEKKELEESEKDSDNIFNSFNDVKIEGNTITMNVRSDKNNDTSSDFEDEDEDGYPANDESEDSSEDDEQD
jgi:hypothetical protein